MKYVGSGLKSLAASVLGVSALLACAPASATAINVVNASFEDLAMPDGTYREGNFGGGWRSFNTRNGVQNPTAAAFPSVPHGVNTAYINTTLSEGANGYIFQTVAGGISAMTRYTLSVDVGWRADGLALADFAVQLVAGDPGGRQVLASGSFAVSEFVRGEFKTLTLVWESDEALDVPLSIVLRGFYRPGQGSEYRQVNFDNLRLDATQLAAVPEPASWGMMMAGLGLIGGVMRRRTGAKVRFA